MISAFLLAIIVDRRGSVLEVGLTKHADDILQVSTQGHAMNSIPEVLVGSHVRFGLADHLVHMIVRHMSVIKPFENGLGYRFRLSSRRCRRVI